MVQRKTEKRNETSWTINKDRRKGYLYVDSKGYCTFGIGYLIRKGDCTTGDELEWGEKTWNEALVDFENGKLKEFEDIVKLQSELKDQSNTKLIEIIDKLTTDFDLTKENIINLTLYLDKVEELYNNTLKEFESRK